MGTVNHICGVLVLERGFIARGGGGVMLQIIHAPKSYDHIHNDLTQLLNQTVSSGQFALCSGVDLRYHSTQAPSYTGTVFPSWKAAKDRTQADTPTNIQLNHSVANVSLSNDK